MSVRMCVLVQERMFLLPVDAGRESVLSMLPAGTLAVGADVRVSPAAAPLSPRAPYIILFSFLFYLLISPLSFALLVCSRSKAVAVAFSFFSVKGAAAKNGSGARVRGKDRNAEMGMEHCWSNTGKEKAGRGKSRYWTGFQCREQMNFWPRRSIRWKSDFQSKRSKSWDFRLGSVAPKQDLVTYRTLPLEHL